MDYFLWGYVKEQVFHMKVHALSEFHVWIRDAFLLHPRCWEILGMKRTTAWTFCGLQVKKLFLGISRWLCLNLPNGLFLQMLYNLYFTFTHMWYIPSTNVQVL
jgi:hypothetical protein